MYLHVFARFVVISCFEKYTVYSTALPSCPNLLDHERQPLSFVNPSVSKHLKASHSHKSLSNSTSLFAPSNQLSKEALKGAIMRMNPEMEGPVKSTPEVSDT
jgi:hypothetical protein